jgi:hypothetical protein
MRCIVDDAGNISAAFAVCMHGVTNTPTCVGGFHMKLPEPFFLLAMNTEGIMNRRHQ